MNLKLLIEAFVAIVVFGALLMLEPGVANSSSVTFMKLRYMIPLNATNGTLSNTTDPVVSSPSPASSPTIVQFAIDSDEIQSVTINKDCATYTQAMFIADVAGAAGVSTSQVTVVTWQCGSIFVTYKCKGNTKEQANTVCSAIKTQLADPNSALYQKIGVASGAIATVFSYFTATIACLPILMFL
eukprot:TRINITY_DN10361_c0_g1_i2.p1 TRINITY_DN10361_c0_g1~~TRINITY_DN10361_c0_g1_i2.p1  ORF type:complete len:195 (+),score=49.01 TRINITY_DN10361_c0_g1_i2:33-587(+)